MYTLPGFLPGRVLVPLDQMADQGAWKSDPRSRVVVSNSLLSDVALEFVPWDAAARRAISSGEFPWINPYAAEGRPLFANPQTALLSPFTWPRLLLGDQGWALCVFMKLVAAGLGAWWLTREMGASSKAALLSGFVYLSSGFSIVWGLHPHTNTFAMLPILAAALLRLLRNVTRSNTLLVITAAALATSGGHPETLAVGIVGIAAFLLWDWFARRKTVEAPSGRRVVWAGLSAAAGFLLLAVQFVPFLLLLSDSGVVETRASGSRHAFRPVALVGQVLPGFLGSPLESELDLSGAVPRGENFNTRNQGFVGTLTLLVLALAAGRQPSSFRRGVTIGIAALVLAWGVPPLGLIVSRAPLLPLVAAPYWIAVFVHFASVAAGPALESVSGGRPHGRLGMAVLVTGFLFVTVGVLPSIPASRDLLLSAGRGGVEILRERGLLKHPPEIYESRMKGYLVRGRWTMLRRLALPGVFWILGGAALRSRKLRGGTLALAVAGELLAFGVGYLPAVHSSRIPPAPEVVRVVRRLDTARFWKVAAAPDIYPPNLATLNAIRDIRSFDVLESSEWSRRLHAYGYDDSLRAFPSSLSREQARGLASEGVRFFFSRSPSAEARLVGGSAPPLVGVYELTGARGSPLPENRPPTGLRVGGVLSFAALLASVTLVWRCRSWIAVVDRS